VVVTALPSVALGIGANRVVQGAQFHYPLGQPELAPEREREWRRALVEQALRALETPVSGPTLLQS
jgi:betaine reductase